MKKVYSLVGALVLCGAVFAQAGDGKSDDKTKKKEIFTAVAVDMSVGL